MDAEIQAQLAHLIALINTLDRKLDELGEQAGISDRKIDMLTGQLSDMADQLAIEILDND